jgi:RNA polymerase sigma-70 factor, ECF subfamily
LKRGGFARLVVQVQAGAASDLTESIPRILAERLHIRRPLRVHGYDMNEPLRLTSEAPASETFEVSRSFETFYDAESRTLFRRMWLVTGNRAEAEELMQDAFLKVWERWEQVGAMEDPVGYLYRTAMNLFRRRYRRALLAIRRSIGLVPRGDDFADADDRVAVRRVLSTLPPRQRAALVLTEMLEFGPREAGRALGVQASTIRSLSHQGRESFRRAMEVDDA